MKPTLFRTTFWARRPHRAQWQAPLLMAAVLAFGTAQAESPAPEPAYAYMAVSSAESAAQTPETITGVEALQQAAPEKSAVSQDEVLTPLAPSQSASSVTEPALEGGDAIGPAAPELLTPLRELQLPSQADGAAILQGAQLPGAPAQPFKLKEVMVYSELPAIAIFAVPRPALDKAFGDVSLVVANEYAARLESRFPNTRIHNPAYALEQLRLQGMEGAYQQLIRYYGRAGRPEPRTLAYVLDKLAGSGPPISRVIFVEADVDFQHLTTSKRPMDMIRELHSGSLPPEQRYHVRSHVEAYDSEQPQAPKLWSFSWQVPVKTTGLYNVTASVFQDSDSLSAFSMAARTLSKVFTTLSPKIVYMKGERQTVTLVSGVVQQKPAEASPSASQGELNERNRRQLERILRDPAS